MKALAVSLLWFGSMLRHRFNPWLRKFYMPWAQQKKKKKKVSFGKLDKGKNAKPAQLPRDAKPKLIPVVCLWPKHR